MKLDVSRRRFPIPEQQRGSQMLQVCPPGKEELAQNGMGCMGEISNGFENIATNLNLTLDKRHRRRIGIRV